MCLIFYTKWSRWPESFAVVQLLHSGGLKGRLIQRPWAPFFSSLSVGNFQDIKYWKHFICVSCQCHIRFFYWSRCLLQFIMCSVTLLAAFMLLWLKNPLTKAAEDGVYLTHSPRVHRPSCGESRWEEPEGAACDIITSREWWISASYILMLSLLSLYLTAQEVAPPTLGKSPP